MVPFLIEVTHQKTKPSIKKLYSLKIKNLICLQQSPVQVPEDERVLFQPQSTQHSNRRIIYMNIMLPCGLSTAPYVVTIIMKPVVKMLPCTGFYFIERKLHDTCPKRQCCSNKDYTCLGFIIKESKELPESE